MTDLTRREFVLKTSAAAAVLAMPALGQDPAPLRVGLVGCGGRGTGAAMDCLAAAGNVQLVALADLFEDRLTKCRNYLVGQKLAGFQVDDAHCFTGFDAYERLLRSDVDLALFATPPGFRPQHVEAAIDAGKHVFMEKPVAVDPAGVRRVIAAGEKAKAKNLAVVAGTQYRHYDKFIATVGRIHAGAVGPLHAARAYYNTGPLWHRGRKPEWSDAEWQIRNWYYFGWLSGDHIVEQHIHTIDVCNWVMQAHPVRAVGVGGRLQRTDPKYGNIYDHFAIDYEYPGGVHIMSMCRQMKGAAGHVGATFVGSDGEASPYRGEIKGKNAWKYDGKGHNPYVREHSDLIASIRGGEPLNEARQVAESTLTAILGREAAYTGRAITWDEMMGSTLDLAPDPGAFGTMATPVLPVPGTKR